MALNATVLPMLINESKQVMSKVSRTEFSGILQPGMTCAMKGENGIALSLPNDHNCRETVATVDMQEDVIVVMMIATMIEAPA